MAIGGGAQGGTSVTTPSRVVALPLVPENPYQRLFYEALARHGVELVPADDGPLSARWLWRVRGRVEIVHFHWPQCYYTRWSATGGPRPSVWSWVKLGAFAGRLLAARLLGFRLAWTIHEVTPFESTDLRLERLAARILARACQVLLANDTGTISRARLVIGRQADRVEVVHHGSFVGYYPAGRPPEVVRKELGIGPDETVFLSFGNLRGYKSLDVLLDAFRRASDLDASLVIAGLPLDEESVRVVHAAAQGDSRVKPLLGFVPDEQVAELFGMSDVSVLARGDGGTSSVLVLSMSMGKPVIAADVEDYRQVAANGQAGWFFEPGDPGSMAAAMIAAAADPSETASRAAAARRCGDERSWSATAERTAQILLGTSR